jgi:hypothetical protein
MVSAKRVMPWPTNDPRAREEYYFRSSLLPDSEVGWCHAYELGRIRQTAAWRADIQAFRRNSGGTTYQDFLKEALRLKRESSHENWPRLFYALWPEWPSKPYLSVSISERKKRVEDWMRDVEPECLEQIDLGSLISGYVHESQWGQSLKTENPLPRLSNHELPKLGEMIAESAGDLAGFRINPHLTVSQFMEQAGVWYVQYHQKRGTKPPETRGASAPAKKLRADLIAVGFWRLVRSGLSRAEAAVFQQNKTDKPLLADEPASWSRAMKRAEKLLRYLLGKRFES